MQSHVEKTPGHQEKNAKQSIYIKLRMIKERQQSFNVKCVA